MVVIREAHGGVTESGLGGLRERRGLGAQRCFNGRESVASISKFMADLVVFCNWAQHGEEPRAWVSKVRTHESPQ